MALEMLRLTTEYVWWQVESPDDLSDVEVEVAFTKDPTEFPEEEDWEEAELIPPEDEEFGDDESWWVKKLIGPEGGVDLTPEDIDSVDYQTWVKIIDSPEVPVRKPGVITII